MTKAPERIWPESVRQHRHECEFKFAPLDVCDCVEKNMADHALALVATAYEVAATRLKQAADDEAEMGNPFNAATFDTAASLTRKRTPDDAQAALERRDARIRNEALSRAWAIADQNGDVETATSLQKLITENKSDE